MESPEHRSAVGRLAEDLQWLEDHCRRQPELAAHAGNLRLASALTRNVIGPFLEKQPPKVPANPATGPSKVRPALPPRESQTPQGSA